MQMLVKDSVMLFYDLKRLLTSLRCVAFATTNWERITIRTQRISDGRYKLVCLCEVIRISVSTY